MDTYLTITHPAEAQITEKRSRFLASVHPVASEAEAKAIVAAYRKRYYDARHVCYAYVVGHQGNITRANDDGEPSGTAGRPILTQLQSHQLTFILAIVVRYFGGVKLGTGPLGVAYRTAISEAIEQATIEERIITASFTVSAPYDAADTAMRYVKEAGANITARDYTATHTLLTINVRLDDEDALRSRLATLLTLQFIDEEPTETNDEEVEN